MDGLTTYATLRLTRSLTVVRPLSDHAARVLRACAPALLVERQRLVAPKSQCELDRSLASALSGQDTAMVVWREDAYPLTLRCMPQGGSDSIEESGVLVILRDPVVERPDLASLQGMFGLTRTEASVTAALASGLRSSDIASAMGVQQNTVLMHIKKVLHKTRTPHQVALLALVLRSVAMTNQPDGLQAALTPNSAPTF